MTLTIPEEICEFVSITLETSAASKLKVDVIDPSCPPLVTTTADVAPSPPPALQSTDESETHVVDTIAESPTRLHTLEVKYPKCAPVTRIITVLPVSLLLLDTADVRAVSADMIFVPEPIKFPEVRTSTKLLPTFIQYLIDNDVSEVQKVASEFVHSRRPFCEIIQVA